VTRKKIRKKSTDSTGQGNANGKTAGSPAREPAESGGTGNIDKGGPAEFPVVGIGASAGGLEAMVELFRRMPADTGMAFVVVTHQHTGHVSMLPGLLAHETAMPVSEASNDMRVEPNHVYVAPAGAHLALLGGVLEDMEPDPDMTPHLPIDYFFRSLADDQRDHAICIVLSGTGTDGTLGLRAVKAESGMAMVQEPTSAKYAGMPASAISTGLADFVLPPAEMPEQLAAYARGTYLATGREPRTVPHEPLQKIFVLLRNRTGHDFSAYKANTIRRRIERRMNLHQITTPGDYVRYLMETPHEIDILFKELLISVTNFFRDADAWSALQNHLEGLIAACPDGHTLRAWVPGSATGEEAYSLAILLRECMTRLERPLDVQIFATDLDSTAIETARAGYYPDGIAVDVGAKRLERFFEREDNGFRVRKEIREMLIFAPQNVIKDPPFTRLDILSCRNLLIYLDAALQKKLLPIFHYALKPGGLLFLGPSETIGGFDELFDSLDRHWKIFRRLESVGTAQAMPEFPAFVPLPREVAKPRGIAAVPRIAAVVERMLMNRFAPASVVINDRNEVLYIHGHTGAYLEPAQGEPHNDLLEMAREGLRIELAAALRESSVKDKNVRKNAVRVKTNGGYAEVDLAISRLREPENVRGLVLVTFGPTSPAEPAPAAEPAETGGEGDDKRVAQLERELRYLNESHQTTREELETSNEELKATNEELQSTNEELQSTNEELETSKEEMQSLNEELTTVNAELQSKLDELSQTSDDMQNLLNATNIATLFLDDELRIKRYTERAEALVHLRPADVGRPISDLASNLKPDTIVADCRRVLKTLAYREAEVETVDGSYYLMRIMPYRTAGNVIDGLVLTFVDISRVHAGEAARDYFESIVDTVREPLLVLDEKMRVISANRVYYNTFYSNAEETAGKEIYRVGGGTMDIPELRRLLEKILPKSTELNDYEVEFDLPGQGKRKFILNARRLRQGRNTPERILLAMEPVPKPRGDGKS